jgi:hypothetical protein
MVLVLQMTIDTDDVEKTLTENLSTLDMISDSLSPDAVNALIQTYTRIIHGAQRVIERLDKRAKNIASRFTREGQHKHRPAPLNAVRGTRN